MQTTPRYALHNLYLDRDQIDTLVTTYTLSRCYRYGFQGQEKDDEVSGNGNSYTAEFWQYDSRLGRRWNIDPVDQISISNYAVFSNNPIFWIDPLGSTVEPTTSQAKKTLELYGEADKTNKKGKIKDNPDCEPAFYDIYQQWKNDDNIHVKFTTIENAQFGGSISYDGINDKGQKVYSVMWDASLTKELGANAIFEETYHLLEALAGIEMAFDDKPNNGVQGLDIYDEVRAKLWVINNINSFKMTTDYVDFNNYEKYTHYCYIKKLGNEEDIKNVLQFGIEDGLVPKPKGGISSSGGSLGGSSPSTYKPMGFGGAYSTFSTTPQSPNSSQNE